MRAAVHAWCFRLLFRLLVGAPIRSGNYVAFRGWMARSGVLHPNFDLCYSSSLVSLGLPTSYVPCERGLRYRGRSHMSFDRLIQHGVRMLMPFGGRIAMRAMLGSLLLGGAGFLLGLGMLAAPLA